MDEERVKWALSQLDEGRKREISFLYWLCHSRTQEIASGYLGFSTAHASYTKKEIYGKLALAGIEMENRYWGSLVCTILTDLLGDPSELGQPNEEILNSWPPEEWATLGTLEFVPTTQGETEQEAPGQESEGIRDQEEPLAEEPEERVNDEETRPLWLILMALTVIIVAVAYLFFFASRPEEPPAPSSPGPASAGSPTPEPITQEDAQEEEPAAQPVPATETSTPTPSAIPPPSDTPAPTNTSSPTNTATMTLTPTETPRPTETPTPTPIPTPSITLPFNDPFDGSQFGPEWDLIVGEPIFDSSGVRPLEGELVVSIGGNLADIVVEFDYGVTPVLNAFNEAPQVFVSLADEIRFAVDPEGPSVWQTFDGNEWRTLAGGREVPSNGHLRLVFSEGLYQAFLNADEQIHSSVGFGGPVTGSVKVRITQGGRIDNFEIRQPQ